ncbi:hypothetical protein HJ526_04855 [Donghicola sp. C2-DW-16]|uniref:Capsular polysaccharide synthesis protein n=1 Tax=Donghicola mangrovi TaxID=2729614 RepID=A0ABX2PB74_9RHOB|nr:capsular polysaccharide synthesis protein [Donghicola mangrovi]NVO26739.1 hypothetical protein [Donghicola mangrovi]
MENRTIYALWNTGLSSAPKLVRNVLRSWEIHAPEYRVKLLEEKDLKAHLREIGLDDRNLPVQAASDILRTKLLRDNGGVWLDATCLLSEPLDAWVSKGVAPSGFFALTRPGSNRLISSWFLAAEPDAGIMSELLDRITDYWSIDRLVYSAFEGAPRWNILGRRARKRALSDPRWSVAPDGGGRAPFAPYYWMHYNFDWLVHNNDLAMSTWSKTPRISAVPAHCLGHAGAAGEFDLLDEGSIRSMIEASPIHKLNWRIEFPERLYEMTGVA